MADTKICRECGKEKPVSEFYLKRILQDGTPHYRPDCRECAAKIRDTPEEKEYARLKTAAWRDADPERGRQAVRDYQHGHREELSAKQSAKRQNPETREAVLEYGRAMNVRHKAKISARNKKKARYADADVKAYMKAYWKANPDKATEYRNRRKALKLKAGGTFKAEDIADIRRMQKDCCAMPSCRVKLNGKGHVDHRIALSKGGTNDRRNLQILCAPCNHKKHTMDEIDFIQSLGFLI